MPQESYLLVGGNLLGSHLGFGVPLGLCPVLRAEQPAPSLGYKVRVEDEKFMDLSHVILPFP